MKAVIFQKYGSPEVLQLAELNKPEPKDNEILVKIKATSVTAGDVRLRAANPWLVRVIFGLFKPKNPVLGHELAGEVVAIGKDVTNYKVGDQVFGATGFHSGTYAEYMALPADKNMLLPMPKGLSVEEAATTTVGPMTALHFLREANIQKGQRILIHGASGSIGSAAIQFAKHFGAHVTAVCSSSSVELVKSLGADEMIDYKRQDFTKAGKSWDIIFSTVGKTSFAESKSVLNKGGVYISSEAQPSEYFKAPFSKLNGKRIVVGVAKERKEDLQLIKDLLEKGTYKPVVDKVFPLEEMVEAHRYVDAGHKKGNVAIAV